MRQRSIWNVVCGLWAIMVGLTSHHRVMADGAPAERPNVILILADDLGWADLGCYGSQFHKTPQLDAMAAQGVRFTQAYATCPVCSPSRASVLTGQYPQRFNITDWLPGRADQSSQKLKRPLIDQQLPLSAVTVAEVLKEAGYRTGSIGKWHLGGEGFGPPQQGFDLNVAGDHAGSPVNYFAPFQRNGRVMPGLEAAPDGEYLTDRLAFEAEKFLEQNREQPFFLYLPHFAVHTPLQARSERIAEFEKSAAGRGVGTQQNPTYAAMLASLDDAVGRVLKKLDELQLSEKTLVIFTSDNGGLATLEGMPAPATINSPLREGKGYLYEGGVRVPCLVRWPGKIPAAVSNVPVSGVDWFPTIIEACLGASQHAVDGVSLLPMLQQSGGLPERDLYWHYPHYSNQGGRPGGAVRSGGYKLIEYYETGRRELFHVEQEAGEGRNLVLEDPARVEQLAQKLDAWRNKVGARMMTLNPEYVPNPQAADGSIVLPAARAEVTGTMLRYEPLPHKNTLGYWVRKEDTAYWEFQVTRPGTFEVEILQGCGAGSGGSEVEFAVGNEKVTTKVEDTGHFQNFVPRMIGTLKIDQPGRHTLKVSPLTKPGVAVMDLRQVRLISR